MMQLLLARSRFWPVTHMGNPRPAAASGVRHGGNGNTARRGDNARRLIKKTHEEEESQLLLDNERMKERRGYLGYAPHTPSSPRGGLETSGSHFLLDENDASATSAQEVRWRCYYS